MPADVHFLKPMYHSNAWMRVLSMFWVLCVVSLPNEDTCFLGIGSCLSVKHTAERCCRVAVRGSNPCTASMAIKSYVVYYVLCYKFPYSSSMSQSIPVFISHCWLFYQCKCHPCLGRSKRPRPTYESVC